MTDPADIDAKIASLGDWRGDILGHVRKLILAADPDVVEELKWRKPSNPGGVPTWSHAGIVCTGETYKDKVKLTFARQARHLRTPPACSMRASMAGRGARSTYAKAKPSMITHSWRWLVRRSRSMLRARKPAERPRFAGVNLG